MAHDLPTNVAWHGIQVRCPSSWEPVAVHGNWKSGQILLADGRSPRAAVSWDRGSIAVDLEKTLDRAARRMARERRARRVGGLESLGSDAGLLRLEADDGIWTVTAHRMPTVGATLVWRSLSSVPPALMGDLTRMGTAVADDEDSVWDFHGLHCKLPPWWRAQGVQVLSGLARGVWFHQAGGQGRVDQVLVLRRLALATTVLAGRSLDAWLRSTVDARDTYEVVDEGNGIASIQVRSSGRTCWRRLRRIPELRRLRAWLEPEADRLVVQETTGPGTDPGCLRLPGASPGCPAPIRNGCEAPHPAGHK